MSRYTKIPKVELDDVERTRTGPMPCDIPDQLKEVEVKEEDKPNIVETTAAVVTHKDTSKWEADIPVTSSETWEQFRRQIKGSSEDDHLIAKETLITLVMEPCQPPNNRRSTKDKLQNEYLNDVRGY